MGKRGFWRRRKGGMETCTTKPKHQTHFISSESSNTFKTCLRDAYIKKQLGTNDCLPKRVSKGDTMLYTTFLRVEKLGGSQSNFFPSCQNLLKQQAMLKEVYIPSIQLLLTNSTQCISLSTQRSESTFVSFQFFDWMEYASHLQWLK